MIQEETPYKTPYTEEEVNAIVRQNEELRKKYDNALEKAEKIYNSDFKPDEAAVLAKYLPILFPELKKESEDKQMIERLKSCVYASDLTPEGREEILTWLEKQGQESKKVSIWKHWKNGIAGNGEGKQTYLIKIGNTYSLSSCLGFECDYIELSELDNLMLEKQSDNKECGNEWKVSTGLYKCIKRMFDGSPEGKLLFETGKLYKCISKHAIAEFESSYGHSVFLIDPVVREHFIKVEDTIEKQDEQSSDDKFETKFKPNDWVSNGRYVKKIIDINSDWPYYIFQDGSSYRIKEVDTKWHIMPNIDELEWMNVHTDEDHCYSCELFDRKNNMCKCLTLCKDPHNTYNGFYVK